MKVLSNIAWALYSAAVLGGTLYGFYWMAINPPKGQPSRYKAGEIVQMKLTGERVIVIGRTNCFGVYGELYDIRNHEGHLRRMVEPEDLKPETK